MKPPAGTFSQQDVPACLHTGKHGEIKAFKVNASGHKPLLSHRILAPDRIWNSECCTKVERLQTNTSFAFSAPKVGELEEK